MITMETTVLILGSLVWVSLQILWPFECWIFSRGVFKGVKLMICLEGGLVLLSSFLLSNWEVLFLALDRASSVFSLFFLLFSSFQAISTSFAFMYFVALKSISAMAFGLFFWTEKRNSPFLSLVHLFYQQGFFVESSDV